MKAMSRSLPIRSLARQVLVPVLTPALALGLCAACGDDEVAAPEPAEGPKIVATAEDLPSGPELLTAGQGGTVAGRLVHAGVVTPPAFEITGDHYCIGAAQDAGGIHDLSLVTGDGGLANAFVYVDVDTDAWEFPEADGEVVIDQVGCLYTPRVVGVRVKQDLTFVNSDATLHNVHTTGDNKEINIAMPIQGMRKSVSMRKVEVMGHVACDAHPWMKGWFGVLEHPCFAVTDGQGRFSIGDVPPGEHTLKVWHETLGTREVSITVAAGGSVSVDDISL